MRKLVVFVAMLVVVMGWFGTNSAWASGKELCNGMDDDGDGLIDEDWPLGEECWSGYGPCRTVGVWTCGLEKVATCKADKSTNGYTPKAEDCNGIDDNCDGLIDNFNNITCFVESPQNACHAGRVTCNKNKELYCTPIPPSGEICGNDADEDCNGVAEVCIGGESPDAGPVDVEVDTNDPWLGVACRQVIYKPESCSHSPTPPHPTLPISTVIVALGAGIMIVRRRRLF